MWMLALRRFRLSLVKRFEVQELCTVCGGSAERYEYVCEKEACQLQALNGQAMLATDVAEPPAAVCRVRPSVNVREATLYAGCQPSL